MKVFWAASRVDELAEYASAVTGELASLCELHVAPLAKERELATYDCLIHNIADLPESVMSYELARTYPGVVILHDRSFHRLVAAASGGGDAATDPLQGYVERLVACYGERAALAVAQFVRGLAMEDARADLESSLPLVEDVLIASEGVVAHLPGQASDIRDRWFGPVADLAVSRSATPARATAGLDAVRQMGARPYAERLRALLEEAIRQRPLTALCTRVARVLAAIEANPHSPVVRRTATELAVLTGDAS